MSKLPRSIPAALVHLPLAAILLTLWLAGALFRLIAGLILLRRAQRLLATAAVVQDPVTQSLIEGVAKDLKLRQSPCLLLSETETEPLAVSHWQDIVLLSRADFARLDREELRAVLAHEFAHIRRADLWLGLVPFATQILFWFHPLAWLACREFAISREAACDAAALQAVKTPTRTYSELLLKLGTRHIPLGPAVALGATSQFHILQRRIIMMHQTPRCSGRRLMVGLTALFVPVIALGLVPWQIVAAQSAPAAAKKPTPALAAIDSHFNYTDNNNHTDNHMDNQNKTDASTETAPGLPAIPANMDFASGMKGWHFSSHDGEQNYFDYGLDTSVRHNGTPSPYLYATANLPKIYGVVTQWISAEPYHGKRVRFSAYIKTEGVKGYAGPMLGLVGGTHDRTYVRAKMPIKGDTDWQRYEYVADVDADVQSLVVGMNLLGKGKVWMNHLAFEVVGNDVPLSPKSLAHENPHRQPTLPAQPVNTDFAHGLKGWMEIEEGDGRMPQAYRIGLDRPLAQHDIAPAFLTSDGSQPNGYGTMVQYIDPAAYRGKRIRLTAIIKTEGVKKYAGLWIGQNTPDWTVWDAEHADIKAPTDWTPVSLVVDVPQSCTGFGMGVLVRGVGKLWVRQLTLETVSVDVPVSPVTLHMAANN